MFAQFVINGLITGVLYSLLAIGFALVYNTTKIFHLAAAALYVFAAFIFHWFAITLKFPIIASAILSIVMTMGISLLMDISVYRPLYRRKASNNVTMIASIGIMIVVVNLMAMIFGNETKVVNSTILKVYTIKDIMITTPQLIQATIGVILLVLFLLFLRLNNHGIRFRALSSDSILYETLGYNTATTRNEVFLISGAFIAVTSCLTVFDIGLDTHMGMNMLINAMVAMILGGIGRFGTCVIGGLTFGVLQSITVYFFSSNWQNAVTFTLLLVLLFLRPQGIAGYKKRLV